MTKKRFEVIIVLWAVSFVIGQMGCKPSVSRLSADYQTVSDIKLYPIQERGSPQFGRRSVELLVATGSQFDEIVVCEGSDVNLCRQGFGQYNRVRSIDFRGGRRFFHLQGLNVEVDQSGNGTVLSIGSYQSGIIQQSRTVRATLDGQLENVNVNVQPSQGTGGTTGELLTSQSHHYRGDGNDIQGTYRLWAPPDNSPGRPQPLIVFFAGDGGSDFLDAQRQQSRDSGRTIWSKVVFVKIHVPQQLSPNTTWSTGLDASVRNTLAQYAHNLLQSKVTNLYNIDMNRVYLIGRSGGANFLTNTFLPKYSRYYSGGAMALCGGESPGTRFTMPQGYRMHFETTQGELPDLVQGIVAGRQFYQEAVGPSNFSYGDQGTGDHCAFGDAAGNRITQPDLIHRIISNWP